VLPTHKNNATFLNLLLSEKCRFDINPYSFFPCKSLYELQLNGQGVFFNLYFLQNILFLKKQKCYKSFNYYYSSYQPNIVFTSQCKILFVMIKQYWILWYHTKILQCILKIQDCSSVILFPFLYIFRGIQKGYKRFEVTLLLKVSNHERNICYLKTVFLNQKIWITPLFANL
jgi:hypothetical protein